MCVWGGGGEGCSTWSKINSATCCGTCGSGYTCQGDEQGVAIHFSHTARDEGGQRDPRACLGHLQVMKEETAALHSEQHAHTARNEPTHHAQPAPPVY